jgi:GT2 family glycosyltransferase
MTKSVLGCLRAQELVSLNIVVIDDGSSDGTAEFLATQEDVTTLRGDGTLWWAGAIDLGLRHVLPIAGPNDFVLLLNNDTVFPNDFVAQLVAASLRNGRAAIGSIIRHVQNPEQILSVGPSVDYWGLCIRDLLDTGDVVVGRGLATEVEVPMLSGRGTLYPVEAFQRAGGMRPRLLPHYFADYELADRVRRSGIPTKVTFLAAVLSLPDWGNDATRMSTWERLFSRRSASNLLFTLTFWSLVGTQLQRVTAVPRWVGQVMKRLLLKMFR